MRSAECRRLRGDRGEIGIIGAIIAILIGAAAAGVTIAVTKSGNKGEPPTVAVQVRDVTASRNSDDRPQFDIKYTALVGPDERSSSPWNEHSRVTCFAVGQNTDQNAFVGEASFFVLPGHSRDDSLVITGRPEHVNVTGEFRVSCEILREGRRFVSSTLTVTMPGPRSPGGGASTTTPTSGNSKAFDVDPYSGTYRVTFTVTDGIELNCGPASQRRSMTLTALSGGRIGLELASPAESAGISSFDASVGGTGHFSGKILFDPLVARTIGLMTGILETRSGAPFISGRLVSDDGHCSYTFEGAKEDLSGTGAVAVVLEQIKGVDGCRAVVTPDRVKAGTVNVTLTNNTFGFAQMFVYDDQNVFVSGTDKTAKEKGGTTSFSLTISAGKYVVKCDGPGTEDTSTPFTVE